MSEGSVTKAACVVLLPQIVTNGAFGIAALVLSQIASASDVTACSAGGSAGQVYDTNYTGLLLGLGITYIVCAGLALLSLIFIFVSEQLGGMFYMLSRVVVGMAGITNFTLSVIGSVRTWQPGWASSACMSATLWYQNHAYYIATWVVTGSVCICSCIASVRVRKSES